MIMKFQLVENTDEFSINSFGGVPKSWDLLCYASCVFMEAIEVQVKVTQDVFVAEILMIHVL